MPPETDTLAWQSHRTGGSLSTSNFILRITGVDRKRMSQYPLASIYQHLRHDTVPTSIS
jgi:hypothetical protein